MSDRDDDAPHATALLGLLAGLLLGLADGQHFAEMGEAVTFLVSMF